MTFLHTSPFTSFHFLLDFIHKNGHNFYCFCSQSVLVDASVLGKQSDSFGSVGEFVEWFLKQSVVF